MCAAFKWCVLVFTFAEFKVAASQSHPPTAHLVDLEAQGRPSPEIMNEQWHMPWWRQVPITSTSTVSATLGVSVGHANSFGCAFKNQCTDHQPSSPRRPSKMVFGLGGSVQLSGNWDFDQAPGVKAIAFVNYREVWSLVFSQRNVHGCSSPPAPNLTEASFLIPYARGVDDVLLSVVIVDDLNEDKVLRQDDAYATKSDLAAVPFWGTLPAGVIAESARHWSRGDEDTASTGLSRSESRPTRPFPACTLVIFNESYWEFVEATSTDNDLLDCLAYQVIHHRKLLGYTHNHDDFSGTHTGDDVLITVTSWHDFPIFVPSFLNHLSAASAWNMSYSVVRTKTSHLAKRSIYFMKIAGILHFLKRGASTVSYAVAPFPTPVNQVTFIDRDAWFELPHAFHVSPKLYLGESHDIVWMGHGLLQVNSGIVIVRNTGFSRDVGRVIQIVAPLCQMF